MSSSSKGKELVQSSDVINDVLKKVEGTNSNAETGKESAKSEKKESNSTTSEKEDT